MDIRIIFSILATITAVIGYLPYLRDIFAKKTKPHTYTWLIWTITLLTATAGTYYGGGKWGGFYLATLVIPVVLVFLLSLKYGTKDITKSDTTVLILTLVAILVWWQLKQPLLSIFMVSAIDFAGYIPSFRKTYKDPSSETISAWIWFLVSNALGILALEQYNLLTTTYLIASLTANATIFLICILRRPYIKKLN